MGATIFLRRLRRKLTAIVPASVVVLNFYCFLEGVTNGCIGSPEDLFDDFTLVSAFGGKADVILLEIEKIRSQLTTTTSHSH